MESRLSTASRYLLTVASCTAALMAGGMSWVTAQQAPQAPAGQAQQGRGGGGGRGNAGPAIFTVVDANKDGAVTRDEMKSTFDKWFTEWDSAKTGLLTQEQLLAGLNAALPAPAPPAGFQGGGRGGQNQTPNPEHVQAMMAALSEPTASRTTRMSSAHSSHVGRWSNGTGSETPVPRRSNRITRLNDASRWRKYSLSGSSHRRSM